TTDTRCYSCFAHRLPRAPDLPLFPYTTLFRSRMAAAVVELYALADAIGAAAENDDLPARAGLGFAGGLIGRIEIRSEAFEFGRTDRKSTRLNSSHRTISYAVFCLKKKNKLIIT